MARNLSLSVWSSDDIRASAVVQVTEHTLNLNERQNTLLDPRLGPLSPHEICMTCQSTLDVCPGHFGFIDLGVPCFHPLFLNEAYATLKTCCFQCGAKIQNSSSRTCQQCDHRLGKWHRRLRKRTTAFIKDYIVYKTDAAELKLTTERALMILSLHGKSDLMIQNMPIIPPCARPTILLNSCKAAFHDLTKLYAGVAKEANLMCVFKKQLQPQHILYNQWTLLQDAVYHVYDTSKYSKSDGGLRQRLDGKQGRFRQNLLGTFQLSLSLSLPQGSNCTLFSIFTYRQARRLLRPHGRDGGPQFGCGPDRCPYVDRDAPHQTSSRDELQHEAIDGDGSQRSARARRCALPDASIRRHALGPDAHSDRPRAAPPCGRRHRAHAS